MPKISLTESDGPGTIADALFSLHIARGHEVVLQIKGMSMWPTIGPHQNLVVKPLSRSPSLGEIVLWRNGSHMVVHRVIGRVPGQRALILTKGDNCRTSDPPVTQSEVVGLGVGIKKREGLFIPWQCRTPCSWMVALFSRMEAKGYRSFAYLLRRTLNLSWRAQGKWNRFKRSGFLKRLND